MESTHGRCLVAVPDRAGYRQKIRTRPNKVAAVVRRYAAYGDAGYLEDRLPPFEQIQPGDVLGDLGRGGEERPECYIVGPVLARLHGQMAAGIACDADLGVAPQRPARLLDGAVFLPQMNPVGSQSLGKADRIVDDEGGAPIGADLLQRLRQACGLVLIHILDPELERRNLAGIERTRQTVRKRPANVKRRDEVKLRGFARNVGFVVHAGCSSPAKPLRQVSAVDVREPLMQKRVAWAAMRISLKLVPTAALPAAMLTGCTVIPPADPDRMQGYPPAEAPRPAPRPAMAYPAPAAPAPYTPAQTYTPPPAQPRLPATPGELPPAAPPTYAAIGQTVTVGGPRITPLAVLEDSRCPMNARCVWAGQVRLRVRIESGRGGEVEMTSGKPVSVTDGALELVDVRPDKSAGSQNNGAVAPSAYRFGFRFSGGF